MNYQKVIHSKDISKFYNFEFTLNHYNIYPWIKQDNKLIRVFSIPNKGTVVAFIERAKENILLTINSKKKIPEKELKWAFNKLIWALGLEINYDDLRRVAKKDKVLRAALNYNRGISPKRYFTLFEACCGAICAQNVDFRRLYQMMHLLAINFGEEINIKGKKYFNFPQYIDIASKSESDIKVCKVGYRAKSILKLAKWFNNNEKRLETNNLINLPIQEAIEKLCELPGIGPYSAAIVLSAGVGRCDIFHFDSFTKQILKTFYFSGRNVSEASLNKFVKQNWYGFESNVAHVLTTNTHIWAKKIKGIDNIPNLTSRARE